VYTSREPTIPQANHTPTTIYLQMSNLKSAQVLGQIDRKFILITINTTEGTLLAAVDQHAADERYRLELILDSLGEASLEVSIQFEIPEKYRTILSQRNRKLVEWGVEIYVLKGKVEITRIPRILKDVNASRWKQILVEYVSQDDVSCPSGLTDIFNSKACRSVNPV
jgi:DNA mismatch repair ATPase MutL